MNLPLTESIRATMQAAFPQPAAPELAEFYQTIEYHLGWRDETLAPATAGTGKLIRPVLSILACRALGGIDAHVLPLAAALQLLHDFTLIHDDIEDHSPQRRGRPTLWSIWGVEIGINAGDGLFAIAHRALYGLVDAGVAPRTVLVVIRAFEETILRICEGQHLDMTGEGRFDIGEERYLQMIRGKTAALLEAATGLGARLATDDYAQIEAMGTFGDALGMAFQMQDDMLDIWGDPQQTGKPFAADLLQRKMSLPVVHAYQHAGSDREIIERIYRQEQVSRADVDELLALLERTGSRAHVAALANREHERALSALAAIRPADQAAMRALHDLAESLLHRAR
jgi:geranylgeranyl diphosphate synthase type I